MREVVRNLAAFIGTVIRQREMAWIRKHFTDDDEDAQREELDRLSRQSTTAEPQPQHQEQSWL